MAVVFAALAVALAPILVAGIRGESLPDGLVNIADKSGSGFAALLGSIGTLLFRQNATDQARIETQSKALDTVQAAIAATPAGKPTGSVNDPINTRDVQ